MQDRRYADQIANALESVAAELLRLLAQKTRLRAA
jgi:hypothetical protein